MDTTRSSLLRRIKDPQDSEAWLQFRSLYSSLLYGFARASGLGHDDAEEVRSACYEAIVSQIDNFEYDREKGRFKSWLKVLARRRIADLVRKRQRLSVASSRLAEVPNTSPSAEELWERHWETEHLRFCVERAYENVSKQTRDVFRLLTEEERSVAEVCEKLALNANQVYKAKSRMLAEIRLVQQTVFPEYD